jgi:hypothetical protein
MHGPNVCRMALPTPVPFADRGARILRDHALPLQEQIIFGALAQRAVPKHDLEG